MSLNDLSRLLSQNTAALAGLGNRKGSIAVMQDADLLIWDPEAEFQVSWSRKLSYERAICIWNLSRDLDRLDPTLGRYLMPFSFIFPFSLLFDFYFLFLFVTFVFWFLPLALPFFWQVTEEMLHFRHKLSPYLGQVLKGRIEMTILRGTPVFSRAAGHLTPTPAGILLLNH
jgi:Amidohydrolase family